MKQLSRFEESSAVAAVAVLASVLYFAGCDADPKIEMPKANTSKLPSAQVRIQTVSSKPQPLIEEVVGTVQSKRHATLEAKFSGRIDHLPVVVGQHVKAGELVVRLDAAEFKARLDQAEASFAQAERDWKRVSALLEQQAVTQAEYETAESRYRVAGGAIAEAKAIIGYLEIVAPFDGVVTKKWADLGDFAAPGKALVAIEDPSVLQFKADVPEAIASHVRHNARLAIRVDGIGKELVGTVSEIGPAADSASRTFRITMELPRETGLRSGRFGRLLVPVGERNSLRIPASAIVQRGQLEIVFVVANQHALLRLVKTGKHVDGEVEILSGLDAGDAVAIESAEQLNDGQPVRVK